ncbi:MAG: hypothetical protein AB7F98_01750 [Novosphingobium sp.]
MKYNNFRHSTGRRPIRNERSARCGKSGQSGRPREIGQAEKHGSTGAKSGAAIIVGRRGFPSPWRTLFATHANPICLVTEESASPMEPNGEMIDWAPVARKES